MLVLLINDVDQLSIVRASDIHALRVLPAIGLIARVLVSHLKQEAFHIKVDSL